MTKVEISYSLLHPLDSTLMARLEDAYKVYGIRHIQVDPSLDSLTVEYDATRLNPKEVAATLGRLGIPIQQGW